MATSAAKRNPTSDLPSRGYFPRLPSWSCATSVPHLRLQLEADHFELRFRVGRPVGGQELDVGEVSGQVEAARELRDVVTIARQALDLHKAIVLLEPPY